MNSALTGVWELRSEKLNGLMIFTETHVCHLFNSPNRSPFATPGEPTDAEAIEAFQTMRAGAGTYSVTGSTVTIDQKYDRIPGNPFEFVCEISIEDDVLTLQPVRSQSTYKLKKVG